MIGSIILCVIGGLLMAWSVIYLILWDKQIIRWTEYSLIKTLMPLWVGWAFIMIGCLIIKSLI